MAKLRGIVGVESRVVFDKLSSKYFGLSHGEEDADKKFKAEVKYKKIEDLLRQCIDYEIEVVDKIGSDVLDKRIILTYKDGTEERYDILIDSISGERIATGKYIRKMLEHQVLDKYDVYKLHACKIICRSNTNQFFHPKIIDNATYGERCDCSTCRTIRDEMATIIDQE